MKKLLSGLFLFVLLSGIVSVSQSDILRVPTPQYPTIQAAFAAAGGSSDKIYLDPNYWAFENLEILVENKSNILLTSDPGISGTARIHADHDDNFMFRFVNCSNITVENLRIEAGSSYPLYGLSAIELINCINCSILDNQFISYHEFNLTHHAIYVENSNYIYIRENYIDNFNIGIEVKSNVYGYWGAHDYTNNTFWCQSGIEWEQLENSQRPRFWNNYIYLSNLGASATSFTNIPSNKFYFSSHGNRFWLVKYPITLKGTNATKAKLYHSGSYYQRCTDRFRLTDAEKEYLGGDSWYKCDDR